MDETGSPQEKVVICDRNTLTGQGRTHGTGAHRGVLRRLKKSHGARGPESASLVCVHSLSRCSSLSFFGCLLYGVCTSKKEGTIMS